MKQPNSIKGILDCLSNEYDKEDEDQLGKLVCQIQARLLN